MADAERKRRIDHAHETQNLTYGHFGTATYDERATHAWRFLRDDEQGKEKAAAGIESELRNRPLFRLLNERVISAGDNEHQGRPLRAAIRARGFNQLVRNDPDLAFGASFWKEETNDADSELNHQSQQIAGQRLAYGYAAELNSRRQPVESGKIPIAATAAGGANEKLCIHPVITEAVTIEDEAGFSPDIQLPSIGNGTVDDGSHSKEPILQICFSPNGPGGMFIGVRRAFSVTVLRSICIGVSHADLSTEVSDPAQLPDIELKEILVLPISRTGESSLAHVAFNPADHHQLAAIDTCGQWSIWRLTGKQSHSARALYKTHMQLTGHLAQPLDVKSTPPAHSDGWYRICWLYDPGRRENVLLVCNRQFLHVYDIDGDSLGDVDMRLGVRIAKHRILDLQASRTHPDLCFVLTSTRVMAMSAAKEQAEPLELVCSWAHGRGAADLSLRMSALELNSQDGVSTARLPVRTTTMHLFIHSARGCEVTQCTFKIEELGAVRIFSARSMASLPLPKTIFEQDRGISDLAFRAVPNDEHIRVSDEGPAQCLISMYARLQGGRVIENVYEYGWRASTEDGESFCLDVVASSAKTRRQARQVKTTRYVDDGDELDDFIVRGSGKEDLLPTSVNGRLNANEAVAPSRMTAKVKNWEEILQAETEQVSERELLRYLAQHHSIAESNGNSYPGKTVAETLPHLRVDDVDETSEAVSNWLLTQDSDEMQIGDEARKTLLLKANTSLKPTSLSDKHSELVDQYVGTLSSDIWDRTRVETERQLRQIGFQAVLAGYVLQRKSSKAVDLTRETSGKDNAPESAAYTLPKANDPPGDEAHSGSALSRLSKYTTVKNTAAPTPNAQTVFEVLGHLPTDINTDPLTYSYNETEFDLAMARNGTDTIPDSRAKRRAGKLARRDKKKVDMDGRVRDDAARNAMSSQVPMPGSSQISQEAGVTMTQPLPVLHGQRERLRKRGGKRKAGF